MFLQHIPMMQTFAHCAFFLELLFLDQDKKQINKDYQDLCQQIIDKYLVSSDGRQENSDSPDDVAIAIDDIWDRTNFEDFIKRNQFNDKDEIFEAIRQLVNKHDKALMYEKYLLGLVYQFKLSETFLEGAPQSILQLSILLEQWDPQNPPTSLQYFSFLTSFVSFTLSATQLYLQHPTKVGIILMLKIEITAGPRLA